MRRHVVPALILAAFTAAFGGLAALSPATSEAEAPDVVVAASGPVLDPAELARERGIAQASRSRRIAEAEAAAAAAAEAARVEAEARAKAEAEAAAAAAAKAEAERAAAQQKAQAAAAAPSGNLACPVPNATFTDTYGASRSGGRSHQGTDLLAPYGSPVYAVVSGRVRTASSSLGGISLYLDGDNGETYFYAHNSANVASNGERVAAGELVAKVGSTGNAGGTNHVHFERQVDGRTVNPYDFLRRIC